MSQTGITLQSPKWQLIGITVQQRITQPSTAHARGQLGPAVQPADIPPLHQTTTGPRLALFSYENLGSTARVVSRKCEMLRCKNSALAIICPLLLINGIDVTVLWAGLAKHSKEISCSRNLVAARHFYDVSRTFYASSYENLVEKKCETRLRSSSCSPLLLVSHPIESKRLRWPSFYSDH